MVVSTFLAGARTDALDYFATLNIKRKGRWRSWGRPTMNVSITSLTSDDDIFCRAPATAR